MPIVAAIGYAVHTDVPGFEAACQAAFTEAVLQANREGIPVTDDARIRERTRVAVNRVRTEFGMETL